MLLCMGGDGKDLADALGNRQLFLITILREESTKRQWTTQMKLLLMLLMLLNF